MDGAAFFDRAMDGESKNPGTNERPDVLRRGGRFFWLLFFGPAKKSDPLAGRRVEALYLPVSGIQSGIKRFRPLARPSSFLLVDAHARSANGVAGSEGASIEDASQRNGTKEKRLSETSTARGAAGTAIFRLGILPRSENAAHPCAAPSGFGFSMRLQQKVNGNGNGNDNGQSKAKPQRNRPAEAGLLITH
ncbi:hypothetical protein [Luteimonas sp. 3794]|uniref:hypothetical protein n=1 Tax=Luteimonas sp. 3794 TaxID=2817730 RepID=UPI002859F5CF|nr:hypothetical protein [Luteimonas sp. 3794]MDR6990044.1 hypothetical protein [Luteimonas sp. 3794]